MSAILQCISIKSNKDNVHINVSKVSKSLSVLSLSLLMYIVGNIWSTEELSRFIITLCSVDCLTTHTNTHSHPPIHTHPFTHQNSFTPTHTHTHIHTDRKIDRFTSNSQIVTSLLKNVFQPKFSHSQISYKLFADMCLSLEKDPCPHFKEYVYYNWMLN